MTVPEIFDVDIDVEKIKVDEQWYSAGDLARAIRERIDAGDYHVSRLSDALERLRLVVEKSVSFRVRVTAEVADDFHTIARNAKLPLGRVLRDALTDWLTSEEATDLLFGAMPGPLLARRRAPTDPSIRLTTMEQDWFETPPKEEE